MKRTIHLSQGPIEVLDTDPDGKPDAIFFVHGLLVDGGLWDGVVERLKGTHRCVVPDLPLGSHKTAMKADADLSPRGVANLIADLIAEMGLEGVTIVANDTGGAITQILVTERPERIGRLVLTPCDAFDNFLPPMFRPLQYAARIPGFIWLMAQQMRIKRARRLPFAYGMVAKRLPGDDVLDRWVGSVQRDRGVRRDVKKLLTGIDKRDTLAAAEKLLHFDKPTLLAWATEEKTFPYEHAHRLAAIIPDSRVVDIPDALAFAPIDNPEAVANAIAEFVQAGSSSDGSVPAGIEPSMSGK